VESTALFLLKQILPKSIINIKIVKIEHFLQKTIKSNTQDLLVLPYSFAEEAKA
jgi:hypothetical protein